MSNSAGSAVGAATGIVLARVLQPAERGLLSAAVVWPTVLGSIAALGMPQAVCYFVARRTGSSRSVVGSAVAVSLASGTILAVVGFMLAPRISSSPDVIRGLRLLFPASPVVLSAGVAVAALQATSNNRWNVSRLTQPISYLLVVVAGFSLISREMTVGVIALLVSFVVQAVGAAFLARDQLRGPRWIDRGTIRDVARFGIHSLAGGLPWLVNGRLDQLVLSIAVPARELGLYAVAVSASLLVVPVTSAFGAVVFPRIAKAGGAGERSGLEWKALKGSAVAAGAAQLAVFVLAPGVLSVLFGAEYRDGSAALRILAVAGFAFALNQTLGDVLRGRGKPLTVSVAEMAGVVVTILFLIVLVPRWGISGAATASLCAYSVTFVLLIRQLVRAGS